MTRFILRTLLGVPIWLLYMAVMLPLMLVGVPLVAVLALYMQHISKYRSHDDKGLLHFPAPFGLRLFYLWDNDEDGVDGDPIPDGVGGAPKNPAWFDATQRWSMWRKVFVWSAWRNSVGNARRLPFLGMDMRDPKDVVVTTPRADWLVADYEYDMWPAYRKLGPYVARYGYRFELKFPWGRCKLCTGTVPCPTLRYFWIGWRIAQQDQPNTDIGFAFQPWAKL